MKVMTDAALVHSEPVKRFVKESLLQTEPAFHLKLGDYKWVVLPLTGGKDI